MSPTRRINAYLVLVAVCGLLTIPSLALAASGGSSITPSGGASAGPAAPNVQPGNVSVTATANGITMVTNASTMLRSVLTVSGTTSVSAAGDTVEIDRLGNQTGWQWTPTATATVAADGTFTTVWSTDHIGRFQLRAFIVQAGASTAAQAPVVTTIVYRPSLATQYGPGFYGEQTACGERLGRGTIGVANRTLKCGTLVAVYYKGEMMIVPVIDHGPYANGADWDLTMATGRALGIAGTAKIGAVSLPPDPAVAARR